MSLESKAMDTSAAPPGARRRETLSGLAAGLAVWALVALAGTTTLGRGLEAMALDAVTNGKRPEQLLIDIMKANKMTYNRARLIARDQIGKLTAQLTEKRSTAIGLDTYTWRTAMDERVRGNPAGRYPTARPSHWGAEGKVGVYGKPTVWLVEGKEVPRGPNDPMEGPSMEIQCRCLAASRWEDLLKPIDASLLEDPYVLAEMGK